MTAVDLLEETTAQVGAAFRARAREGEAMRTMPADLVELAKSAGLFRIAMPRSLGGLDLEPAGDRVDDRGALPCRRVGGVDRADRQLDGVLRVARSRRGTARCSPERATSFRRACSRRWDGHDRDGGQFVIDGRWPFNSGCMHAEWYQAAVVVMDGDRPARPPRRPTRHAVRVLSPRPRRDHRHVALDGAPRHRQPRHRGTRASPIPIEHTASPMLDLSLQPARCRNSGSSHCSPC